jgi:magnesium transporter
MDDLSYPCGEGCYCTRVSEYVFIYLPKVLAGTGVGQIKYLNRALMRFDSKVGECLSRTVSRVYQRDAMQVVIPTQFVLFTLSAILGSAILYGDFRTAKFHQFMTFVYGCAATFAGVWIITWEPTSDEPSVGPHDTDGAISDVETEGLSPLADGIPVVGVGRKLANLPVLKARGSNVSLVGISPAQVQFCPVFFFVPDLIPWLLFPAPAVGTHATPT